jgi:hypothetical protein
MPLRKLTPKTQQALVDAIKSGLHTKVDMCALAKISAGTLTTWERLAAEGEPQCIALVEAMAAAEAERKAQYIRRMQRSGRDDWRMWEARLAAVDRANYGKVAALEISGKLQTEDVTLDDVERAARIAELLDLARARRDGQADSQPPGDVPPLRTDGGAAL